MRNITSIAVTSMMVVALAAVPVSAQGHSTDQRDQRGQERGQTAQQEHQQQDGETAQNHTRQQRQIVQEDVQQRRESIQQQVEERHAEVKQQVCERKQEQLQRVIPRLATRATALKNAIDRVYENVQGFVEDEQVVVEGYEEHKSSVDAAQEDAGAAVQVVENYEFELDCDDPNVGGQLDGFRLAVEEAREALTVYRDELVHLIQEMRAEEADNTDEDEEENDQNGDTNGAGNASEEGVENAQ